MMKELWNNKKAEIFICIFFIVQPLIDIYKSLMGDTISIMGFAIEELFNLGYIFLLLCYLLYSLWKEKQLKVIIKYVIYFVFVGAYIVLHCWNIYQFNTTIYPDASPSFIYETYYIIRAYLFPIVLMFTVYNLKLSNQGFSIIVKSVVGIISAVIVFSNLFGISFIAYSLENEFIHGNIFSWFSLGNDAIFDAYTSKGWFYSANQISALLFGLAPVMVYEAIKKFNWQNALLVLLQLFAMLMLGTKTAAMGMVLVMVVLTSIAVFLHLVKIEKIANKCSVLFLTVLAIIGYSLYQISPSKIKYSADQASIGDREEVSVKPNEVDGDNQPYTLANYIEQYGYYYYIQPDFPEMYPVAQDEEFWTKILERDRTLNVDNRVLKMDISNRILERNNNKKDTLLGIGYTSNLPYTERDYAYQFYIFGGLGIFFLMGSFIIALLYALYRVLPFPKTRWNLRIISMMMSLFCILSIAYFAGHVFGMLINMYFMGLYAAVIMVNIKGMLKQGADDNEDIISSEHS